MYKPSTKLQMASAPSNCEQISPDPHHPLAQRRSNLTTKLPDSDQKWMTMELPLEQTRQNMQILVAKPASLYRLQPLCVGITHSRMMTCPATLPTHHRIAIGRSMMALSKPPTASITTRLRPPRRWNNPSDRCYLPRDLKPPILSWLNVNLPSMTFLPCILHATCGFRNTPLTILTFAIALPLAHAAATHRIWDENPI